MRCSLRTPHGGSELTLGVWAAATAATAAMMANDFIVIVVM